MYDPDSAGTLEPRRLHRVRCKQDGTLNRFTVRGWDDRSNVLYGITYRDRIRIVFAVEAVMEEIENVGSQAEEMKRAYVTWVALEMFSSMVRRRRLRWGTGALGQATPSQGNTGRPRRGNAKTPPRSEDLLLNAIRPEYVDRRFKKLNYPHEIHRLRKDLFDLVFSRGLYIPSHDLVLGVVEQLVRAETGSVPPGYLEHAASKLAKRTNLIVPGLRCPFNPMTVPRILQYYGLATRKRGPSATAYYVKPWRVEALTRLWQRDRFIDLRDVYWMTYTFLPPRDATSHGGRHSDIPARDPATGAALRQDEP